MNKQLPRIHSVAADPPTGLQIKWKGGGSARVDLAGWIATGGDILAPLRDPQVFGHPRVAEHGAAVEWGGDDDLAIDAVHLQQIAVEQQPLTGADLARFQADFSLSDREIARLLGIAVSTWNAYKAGGAIPAVLAMLLRALRRDPLLLKAHFQPLRPMGRPRKTG